MGKYNSGTAEVPKLFSIQIFTLGLSLLVLVLDQRKEKKRKEKKWKNE